MNNDTLKKKIDSLSSHILFNYKEMSCGIDPLNRNHIDMWYGNNSITVKSIDRVMSEPFFDGKCLNDIASEIQNVEW